MSSRDLAIRIMLEIFEVGAEPMPGHRVQRIQFMGGKYPDGEIPMGGLGQSALVAVIQRAIESYQAAPPESK